MASASNTTTQFPSSAAAVENHFKMSLKVTHVEGPVIGTCAQIVLILKLGVVTGSDATQVIDL
jgi:hypothetical protein